MVTNITILFEENKGLPNYFHYLSADYMWWSKSWL